jgi:hypothetical protein
MSNNLEHLAAIYMRAYTRYNIYCLGIDIGFHSAVYTVRSVRLLKIYNTNAQIVLFTDAGGQLLGTFC